MKNCCSRQVVRRSPQTGLQMGNLSSIERLMAEASLISGYCRLREIGRQNLFCKMTSIRAVRSSHQTGIGWHTTRMSLGHIKSTYSLSRCQEGSIRFLPQEEAIQGGGVMEKSCST